MKKILYLIYSLVLIFPEITKADAKPERCEFKTEKELGAYMEKLQANDFMIELKRLASPEIFPVKALHSMIKRGFNLPVTIDGNTTIQDVSYTEPNLIKYHYKISLPSTSPIIFITSARFCFGLLLSITIRPELSIFAYALAILIPPTSGETTAKLSERLFR